MKVMTSKQIRQSFLDFFHSKQHTIVPSSSLLPDSPNLLFTNAGMNQFVPIFLGQKAPDVSRWAGVTPGLDTRAADTQKCIRAGGKHNDLEDVGLDTYHHTFFEMLGNWSFGDYFKKESIQWGWELLTKVWGFPAHRLYATVYSPDKSLGDPAEFDQEAYDIWAEIFRSEGLDPSVHIVHGNKKDNFWMMGDTGPCGPCSEIHVDLTPNGDTHGKLVNQGSPDCMEIWNHVFIQFNANPDGSFAPLPARHVDTGMGFERAASIIQGTKGFTDFAHAKISNYETDIFRPIFDAIEKLSGKTYTSTLPAPGSTTQTEQEKIDIAFRVIADHIRTLSFAIADGIPPGNTDRNYVLRRILRRAVKYGRTLGFREPFFYKLAAIIADTMGDVFPEARTRLSHIQSVLKTEEDAFNRTLDKGMELFQEAAAKGNITAAFAFKLYDEQGFPLDLTELLARERGLTVDVDGFHACMEQQRARARAAQKKTVIELSQVETLTPTTFNGFDALEADARVLEVVELKDKTAVVLDVSTCYAEMGGQVGDSAVLEGPGGPWIITNTQKSGNVWLHFIEGGEPPAEGSAVHLRVDRSRRAAIERHHTVTHLMHWALHQVVGPEASQKGSYVGPDKLTFDFNSAALTPAQVHEIERRVNELILDNAPVSWIEVPYTSIHNRKDIMQFFGDKYGDTVRVVQIGGAPRDLNGYSMELCGGTHVRATGQIGLFRILSEGAIAAGIRRIEAVAGLAAYDHTCANDHLLHGIAELTSTPLPDLQRRIENMILHVKEQDRQLRAAAAREAAAKGRELLTQAVDIAGVPTLIATLPGADAEAVQAILDALKPHHKGILVLAGTTSENVALAASVDPSLTAKISAGKIIQTIAPHVGGRGGGKPDHARGGGKDASGVGKAMAEARSFVATALGGD